MQQGRVVTLCGTTGFGADKALFFRHLDVIPGRPVERLRSAVADVGAGPADEPFCVLDRLNRVHRFRQRDVVAVHLVGIEDRAGPREQAGLRFGFTGRFVFGGNVDLLVEDDGGRLLALAHLRPGILPLAIGAPGTRSEAADLGGSPQGDNIDAPITVSGVDVDRAVEAGPGAVPGHLPLASTGFDGGDDGVRHLLVDVHACFADCVHGKSPEAAEGA